jgi:hypothetical protein
MSKPAKKTVAKETDNAYFLKILIYFTLGMLWVKINGFMVLPVGLVLGLIIAQHDHFAIDRKIEYAVLVVSTILGLWGGIALVGFWFGK